MENLRSLKMIVRKETSDDRKLISCLFIFNYLIVTILIILLALANNKTVMLSGSVCITTITTSIILLIISNLWMKHLEKRMLEIANRLIFSFFREKIINLFRDYFGKNIMSSQENNIRNLFLEMADMPFCRIVENDIEIFSEIQLKSLKHIFKHNGRATILVRFEIDNDEKLFMFYIKNEDPGDFKQHSFPYIIKH